MSQYILFAYIDSYDLNAVASMLENSISSFIQSREWKLEPWLVSQRGPAGPRPEDLPRWDLGVNIALPDEKEELRAGFSDIEAVAEFLRGVSAQVSQEFVVGVSDTKSVDQWEIAFIDGAPVNIARIRRGLRIDD